MVLDKKSFSMDEAKMERPIRKAEPAALNWVLIGQNEDWDLNQPITAV